MTQPAASYVGTGVAASATAAPVATTYQSTYEPRRRDLNFILVEVPGNSPCDTPAGYHLLTGLPIQTGATAADTKMYVFWKRLDADDEPTPAITGFTDHALVRQVSYRFARHEDDDIFVDVQTAVKSGSSALTTWPQVTTVDRNTAILFFATHPGPTGDTWDDGNITVGGSPLPSAVIFENWTNAGNDGGILGGRYFQINPGLSSVIECPRLVSGADVTVTIAIKSATTLQAPQRGPVPGPSPLVNQTFKRTEWAGTRGKLRIQAEVTASEAPDTASITVSRQTGIALAATEAKDTLSMAVHGGVDGYIAATEAKDVAALTLHRQTPISLAVTEAKDIAAIIARSPIFATLSSSEAPDVASIGLGIMIEGEVAATEAPDVMALSVHVPYPPLATIVQRASPGALIFLYELDLTSFGAGIVRFTPMVGGPAPNHSEVRFGGNIYTPISIEAKGFEKSAKGKAARPSLRINNVTNMGTQLLRDFRDLKGVRMKRLRTFAQYLDPPDGFSPDAGQTLPVEHYIISRKAQHNKVFIEFELRAAIDIEGVVVPKRTLQRNCMARYRIWDATTGEFTVDTSDMACPYANPTFFFDAMNTITADPARDKCSKTIDGCKARFGERAALPYKGFPGAQRVR